MKYKKTETIKTKKELDFMQELLDKDDLIATLNETITKLQKEIEMLKNKTCNCHKSPSTFTYEVQYK